MPRTASTDDANARGRCATRCYIRRLIDRRAQARRMAAFAVSGYSITTHFAKTARDARKRPGALPSVVRNRSKSEIGEENNGKA